MEKTHRSLRDVLLGPRLRNSELEGEKFKVVWGLPIYSSDTISSVAYAGEEILLVLAPVLGAAAGRVQLYIMCAIIGLLAILVFCYRQTIDAYPQGGGAYVVGMDNLGLGAGLVAAAALSTDYILTVAVSSSSGTLAIISAFPALAPARVWIAFGIVCLLTWGNLRGMRESSVLFGLPTYFFILALLVLIVVGFARVYLFGYQPPPAAYTAEAAGDATLFLIIHAFTSGCTALTGVEAVSNGVPSFRAPAAKNAKRVLMLMAVVVGVTFLCVSALTGIYRVMPTENVTAVAALASAVFRGGPLFYIFQIATVIILCLAANTAFAGMPPLLAMVAADGYAPRQFSQRGTKLNFSNGILFIFVAASLLIFVFQANTHRLLPLYATGVFISFTISQAGMLRHWTVRRESGWRRKALVNGVGTVICAAVCLMIAVTRFTSGAWLIIVIIPVLVLLMLRVNRHYRQVADALRVDGHPGRFIARDVLPMRIIMPVQSVNRSFIKAVNYALTLRAPEIEFYHVSSGDAQVDARLAAYVEDLRLPNTRLVVEETELRNTNEVLLRHIDEERAGLTPGQLLTVVLPQFVIRQFWGNILHNQTSVKLKLALDRRPNVILVSVPYIF